MKRAIAKAAVVLTVVSALATVVLPSTTRAGDKKVEMESSKSRTESEILDLSREKFRWKTERELDPLAELFDDEVTFVHLNGVAQSKADWIRDLRSGRFVYNKIDVKQASVKLFGATAVLMGRASFTVTIGGHRATYNLAYTEVYVKRDGKWKIVSLHTCLDSTS
jgi:hypothetical protein